MLVSDWFVAEEGSIPNTMMSRVAARYGISITMREWSVPSLSLDNGAFSSWPNSLLGFSNQLDIERGTRPSSGWWSDRLVVC
jgi:hypothetical protein